MGKEPAMRPTDTPIEDVLNRSTGPRRIEVQDLLDLFCEVSGEELVVWRLFARGAVAGCLTSATRQTKT